MTVVAIDGGYVAPLNLQYIECAPGQRYDVILTANQPSGAYWMTVTSRYRPAVVTGAARVIYSASGLNARSVPASNATAISAAVPPSDSPDFVKDSALTKQIAIAAVQVHECKGDLSSVVHGLRIRQPAQL